MRDAGCGISDFGISDFGISGFGFRISGISGFRMRGCRMPCSLSSLSSVNQNSASEVGGRSKGGRTFLSAERAGKPALRSAKSEVGVGEGRANGFSLLNDVRRLSNLRPPTSYLHFRPRALARSPLTALSARLRWKNRSTRVHL